MTIEWLQGDRPRLRFYVVDEDASPPTAYDPATVRFVVKPPTGPRVTLVYGVDAVVVRDSTGVYHVDVELTAQGEWWVRAEGLDVAGASLVARETPVTARASRVLP